MAAGLPEPVMHAAAVAVVGRGHRCVDDSAGFCAVHCDAVVLEAVAWEAVWGGGVAEPKY